MLHALYRYFCCLVGWHKRVDKPLPDPVAFCGDWVGEPIIRETPKANDDARGSRGWEG